MGGGSQHRLQTGCDGDQRCTTRCDEPSSLGVVGQFVEHGAPHRAGHRKGTHVVPVAPRIAHARRMEQQPKSRSGPLTRRWRPAFPVSGRVGDRVPSGVIRESCRWRVRRGHTRRRGISSVWHIPVFPGVTRPRHDSRFPACSCPSRDRQGGVASVTHGMVSWTDAD